MLLKIIKGTEVLYRTDFYKITTNTTHWDVEWLRGTLQELKAVLEGPIYELWEYGECLATLEPPKFHELNPNQLYQLYFEETGQNATYMKKDQEIEYREYQRWLNKKQKEELKDE